VVSKVRGRFDKFEGQIVTGEDPLQSAAAVAVDLNSVNTGDQTRDDDLRSAKFFDAANYPTMTYRSTGVRRDGEQFALDGELTVRGVTRPVSLTPGRERGRAGAGAIGASHAITLQ
jgi:polyisoprenoid-binding protein YceI